MIEKLLAKKRKGPPIRGWLAAVTILMAVRVFVTFFTNWGILVVLLRTNPRYNPVYFLFVLLDVAVVVTVVGLYIASLVGVLQGDPRFRKYFRLQLIIRLVGWFVRGITLNGADAFRLLLIIAFWDVLMLLYFYKSRRVQAAYFPEVK